jgi:hypothetical protein
MSLAAIPVHCNAHPATPTYLGDGCWMDDGRGNVAWRMEVDSARSGPIIGEGVPRLVSRFLTFQHCFWRGANRRGTASQRQSHRRGSVVEGALTVSHLSVGACAVSWALNRRRRFWIPNRSSRLPLQVLRTRRRIACIVWQPLAWLGASAAGTGS